jgi:hypothetical protein
MPNNQHSARQSWWQAYKRDARENWRLWLAVHIPGAAVVIFLNNYFFG